MKRFLFIFLAFGFVKVQAQLVNDGATIIIKPGATLYVETNVQNNAGSTLTVEGTLNVKGNLTNDATMTTTTGSLVKFTGTGASTFKSNGAAINNLEVSKENNKVTLVDALSVPLSLSFGATGSSHLELGDNNLTLGTTATITGADANEYIITNSTSTTENVGIVSKLVTAGGSFTYPIGDDATDYSPITAVHSGTYAAGAAINTSVRDVAHPNKLSDADAYLSRYWNVNQTGITGYSNTLTATYVDADITGTDTKIKGANYATSEWTFLNAAGDVALNTVTGTTSAAEDDFTGKNFYGRVNLTVFLAGALSGTAMTTTLNSLLPVDNTPYTVAPFNAPALTAAQINKPSNATDWILIEALDATTPTTVLSKTSGFVLSDGTVVSAMNGPLYLKDANATSIIGVKHRNHLAIRTASGLNLASGTVTPHNFSTGTGQAYTNSAYTNANMKGTAAPFSLWAGDVDNNGRVRYLNALIPPIPSDALAILTNGLGGVANASLTNVYNKYDVNMDNKVRYLNSLIPPIPSDALFFLTNTLGGISNADIRQHY